MHMESYFVAWLSRQEELLGELVAAPRHPPERHVAAHRDLTARVLDHYRDYYQEKASIAATDVLPLFSPPWLSPLERAFLWCAGWRPSLAFRLLSSCGVRGETSAEQKQAVEDLRRATAAEEKAIGEEMARVQESIAMPQVLRFARGQRDVDMRADAVDAFLLSLQHLVASADSLRARTIAQLVDILTPLQNVDFLAAAAELHLRVRDYGTRRPATPAT